MKIRLIQIGKTQEKYIAEGIDQMKRRIQHYVPFEDIIIPSLKNMSKYSTKEIVEKETKLLLKQISLEKDYVVLLNDRGKTMTSESFSEFINDKMNYLGKNLVFVVGGAYGVSELFVKKAQFNLSLSKMVFTHQMVRLIFLEQLYRAFTIIHNEPYHHA